MNVNATLFYSEETLRPYLVLDDFYKDYDGEETVTIESDGVGLIQGDHSMDLPFTYYNIDKRTIDSILKNNGKCRIKMEDGLIKRISDKVIILK